MMIGIGSILFGLEVQETTFSIVLNSISLLLGMARTDEDTIVGHAAGLNPVFHVPGSLGSTDFEGLRTGKFSRKEKMLMVQIAVPEEIAASDEPMEFILESLREAVRIGKRRFAKAKIDFDEDAFLELVSQVEREYATYDGPDAIRAKAMEWRKDVPELRENIEEVAQFVRRLGRASAALGLREKLVYDVLKTYIEPLCMAHSVKEVVRADRLVVESIVDPKNVRKDFIEGLDSILSKAHRRINDFG